VFAHYDNAGSLAKIIHTHLSFALIHNGADMEAGSVIDRMKPYTASGEALAPYRLLYLASHDHRENIYTCSALS
jgi:hypothetical protein